MTDPVEVGYFTQLHSLAAKFNLIMDISFWVQLKSTYPIWFDIAPVSCTN
jgi:hypothetical protein